MLLPETKAKRLLEHFHPHPSQNLNMFGHMAKECRAPKRRHDYGYHTEKMLLCKKEASGGQLSVGEHDWLIDTDEEPKDQKLEAYYIYMAKI
ncbi:hypothetical protein Tco_0295158 [Tanacetum coccineum]